MAFWVFYDHLGKLMLANLTWSAALLAPTVAVLAAIMTGDGFLVLAITVPAVVLLFGVLVPVFGVGLAYLAKELIDTGEGSFLDVFRGIGLYWRRAIGVGLVYAAAVTALLTSAWFYGTRLGSAAPLIGYAIGGLAAWCMALVVMTQMLVMPALVQKKVGVAATLKLSALLVLDNPFFCLGLSVYFLALAALSVAIPPFGAFFAGSLAVVLSSTAYEMLARKYAAIEREKTGTALGAAGREGSVVSRGGKLVFDDTKDDYLNRGFRDFWTPWKA
jgi:uncharacterized membrane protein YesL